MQFDKHDLLYEKPLACPEDASEFHTERGAAISFPHARLRMENAHDPDQAKGRHGNFILWCEREFPTVLQ